jgi:hypothetical protein
VVVARGPCLGDLVAQVAHRVLVHQPESFDALSSGLELVDLVEFDIKGHLLGGGLTR